MKPTALYLLPLMLSCASLISGCAYSYIDDAGTRHVIGLVNLELPRTEHNDTIAGQIVDLTTVGIAVGSNDAGSNVTVGYNREITGYLRNNALVIGDPLATLSRHKATEEKE